MAASQLLLGRQECTTALQSSFTFSPKAHRQKDLLPQVGTVFVISPQRRRSSETCRTTHWTRERWCSSTSPPYKPFSWVCLLLPSDGRALQTCLPPFSTTLQLHNRSEGAGTAQLGVGSGTVAQAELITHCRLWDCIMPDKHPMTSREQP